MYSSYDISEPYFQLSFNPINQAKHAHRDKWDAFGGRVCMVLLKRHLSVKRWKSF